MEAGVLDHREAGGSGFFGSGRMHNALLEPKDFCADGDSRIGDGSYIFGPAKDVYDVHWFRDIFKAGECLHSKHFRFVRIHRNNRVANRLKVGGNSVRWAERIRGEANDRDGLCGPKNLRDRVGRHNSTVRAVKNHQGFDDLCANKVIGTGKGYQISAGVEISVRSMWLLPRKIIWTSGRAGSRGARERKPSR